jgi:hypothetical protein
MVFPYLSLSSCQFTQQHLVSVHSQYSGRISACLQASLAERLETARRWSSLFATCSRLLRSLRATDCAEHRTQLSRASTLRLQQGPRGRSSAWSDSVATLGTRRRTTFSSDVCLRVVGPIGGGRLTLSSLLIRSPVAPPQCWITFINALRLCGAHRRKMPTTVRYRHALGGLERGAGACCDRDQELVREPPRRPQGLLGAGRIRSLLAITCPPRGLPVSDARNPSAGTAARSRNDQSWCSARGPSREGG